MRLEEHNGISVWRDDLLPGGSKTRFLTDIVKDANEVVYGAPFCGGAPVSLSFIGRSLGIKITIFYAKRKELHRYQKLAQSNGASIIQVPYGYMNVVQKAAREYAASKGAMFLPLGFDVPQAQTKFVNDMISIRHSIGTFDEVWCATGSGMLAKCLSGAWFDAKIMAVAVGLASRHEAQTPNDRVVLLKSKYKFEQPCKQAPPFPSNTFYDAKAWELLQQYGRRGKRILFWNVMN